MQSRIARKMKIMLHSLPVCPRQDSISGVVTMLPDYGTVATPTKNELAGCPPAGWPEKVNEEGGRGDFDQAPLPVTK